MALSAFTDSACAPQAGELRALLGRSSGHWEQLVAQVVAAYPPIEAVWHHAGARWGWSLRLKQKQRVILYLTPCERHFLVGVVLGEKAVAAARARPLPAPALALIAAAPKYAEGRGIRFAVRTKADLATALALVAAKQAGSA